MLTSLSHLALEVKYLDRARSFYVDRLGLDPARNAETEVVFAVGPTDLLLRRPESVPRGGLHVHYAFTTPTADYERWADRLADLDPEEVSFGSYRSLYVDDPDDHCVEVGGIDFADGEDAGGRTDASGDDATAADPSEDGATGTVASGVDAPRLTSVFEVVLEVADLDRAEAVYGALGFEPVDRGGERRRVRLRAPFGDAPGARPLDLELWEPQLGLADARGGAHIDIGFGATDPDAAVEAVRDAVDGDVACEGAESLPAGGRRVRDPDCHYVTFVPDAET